jgi:hypothetical protein
LLMSLLLLLLLVLLVLLALLGASFSSSAFLPFASLISSLATALRDLCKGESGEEDPSKSMGT